MLVFCCDTALEPELTYVGVARYFLSVRLELPTELSTM